MHVGASCPPDRLAPLLCLLRPEGGLIVTPVNPSDLRIITKRPDGSVTQKARLFRVACWPPGHLTA